MRRREVEVWEDVKMWVGRHEVEDQAEENRQGNNRLRIGRTAGRGSGGQQIGGWDDNRSGVGRTTG